MSQFIRLSNIIINTYHIQYIETKIDPDVYFIQVHGFGIRVGKKEDPKNYKIISDWIKSQDVSVWIES